MDASSAVLISQLSRMLVQGGSCSKDCQAMVLKHPASSQEEHGAPAGTRTPIDGLGNRHPLFLVDAQERVLLEVFDYGLFMKQKE